MRNVDLSLEGGEVEDSAEGEHEVEDPTEEEDDELEEDDVVQFAIGDYAVVQGAFATGFSSPGRTWPGHVIRLVVAYVISDLNALVLFCQV